MTALPSVLLTLQGNLSKPLSPQVKPEKILELSWGVRCYQIYRTVGLWRDRASQAQAERSVFSLVLPYFKQSLPSFGDWSKPLLYVATCLCCCTQLGLQCGFWMFPADLRVSYIKNKSVNYRPSLDSTFCAFWILPKCNALYNNQISDFYWEICKTLKRNKLYLML